MSSEALPKDTRPEQREISAQNKELLYVAVGGGEPPRFIDAVSAAKLLGSISTLNRGMENVSYLIPEKALIDAHVDIAKWVKTEAAGDLNLRFEGKVGNRQFELPQMAAAGVNDFIQQLEEIAGISYPKARGTADKYKSEAVSTPPGTERAR